MKSVYVAASSDEQERAKKWIAELRANGVPVTSNWIETIAANGGKPNPRGVDANLVRLHAAATNEEAIDASSVLWFLVPSSSPGCGGFWESGYARKAGKHLVFSGDTHRTVFCAQGHEFATDSDAFRYILTIASSRS